MNYASYVNKSWKMRDMLPTSSSQIFRDVRVSEGTPTQPFNKLKYLVQELQTWHHWFDDLRVGVPEFYARRKPTKPTHYEFRPNYSLDVESKREVLRGLVLLYALIIQNSTSTDLDASDANFIISLLHDYACGTMGLANDEVEGWLEQEVQEVVTYLNGITYQPGWEDAPFIAEFYARLMPLHHYACSNYLEGMVLAQQFARIYFMCHDRHYKFNYRVFAFLVVFGYNFLDLGLLDFSHACNEEWRARGYDFEMFIAIFPMRMIELAPFFLPQTYQSFYDHFNPASFSESMARKTLLPYCEKRGLGYYALRAFYEYSLIADFQYSAWNGEPNMTNFEDYQATRCTADHFKNKYKLLFAGFKTEEFTLENFVETSGLKLLEAARFGQDRDMQAYLDKVEQGLAAGEEEVDGVGEFELSEYKSPHLVSSSHFIESNIRYINGLDDSFYAADHKYNEISKLAIQHGIDLLDGEVINSIYGRYIEDLPHTKAETMRLIAAGSQQEFTETALYLFTHAREMMGEPKYARDVESLQKRLALAQHFYNMIEATGEQEQRTQELIALMSQRYEQFDRELTLEYLEECEAEDRAMFGEYGMDSPDVMRLAFPTQQKSSSKSKAKAKKKARKSHPKPKPKKKKK